MPSVPNRNKRLRVAYPCFTQTKQLEPVAELTDVEKFQAYLPAVISVVVEETNENVENLSRYL